MSKAELKKPFREEVLLPTKNCAILKSELSVAISFFLSKPSSLSGLIITTGLIFSGLGSQRCAQWWFKHLLCLCDQVGDAGPPAAVVDQMYYSAVSTLDRKDSVSSDEDGDIYRQTGRDVSNCPPNRTDKTGDGQMSLDELNRGLHKPDQVGIQHHFQINIQITHEQNPVTVKSR